MDIPQSYEWNHDQNIPEEAKSKSTFWELIDSGAFKRGEVKDPRLIEMYKSLMNEPMA
jgi:hypothetical protein